MALHSGFGKKGEQLAEADFSKRALLICIATGGVRITKLTFCFRKQHPAVLEVNPFLQQNGERLKEAPQKRREIFCCKHPPGFYFSILNKRTSQFISCL